MPEDYRKYFQIEATELLDQMTAAVGRLREGNQHANEIHHLMRLAHTLKGAAYVVEENEIGNLGHELEDTLEPRVTTNTLPGEIQHRVFQIIDLLSESLTSRKNSPVPRQPPSSSPQPKVPSEVSAESASVRVELAEIQELVTTISEASVALSGLHESLESLGTASATASALTQRLRAAPDGPAERMAEQLALRLQSIDRDLNLRVQAIRREVVGATNIAAQIRLIALDTLEPLLRRTVLTTADSLGKSAQFRMESHGERVDTHLLSTLRGPLLHIVRNAVAHGIEEAAVRIGLGKHASGQITLRCQTDRATLTLVCEDDGAGIDPVALRQKLVREGILPAKKAAEESDAAIVQYIFAPGVSTTLVADSVSGRGFGLDIVRETVQGLHGTWKASSEFGRGTRIELRIPLDLYSTPVITGEAGFTRFSLPFASVKSVLQIGPGDIVYGDGGRSIDFRGELLRLVSAASLFGDPVSHAASRGIAMIVQSEDGAVALQVDRLLGTKVVVRQTLPSYVQPMDFVGGVSLDEFGTPELILDAAGLVETPSSPGAPAQMMLRRNVLVIDDSLTTRTLEQSILETAGYYVEVAESAEEGLRKAGQQQYDLFLVDIEMPGMNGFEFVATVKANSELQHIPCILVTSKSGEADQERGRRVGAADYIVKGDFNQQYLLSRIAELLPR
jgi:two-component system chemotaxis sensor kinase CheA